MDKMTQQQRNKKNLKIGIGILIIIVGISISVEKLPYDQFMNQQVVVLAYIAVGILIILGTGKIKRLLGK